MEHAHLAHACTRVHRSQAWTRTWCRAAEQGHVPAQHDLGVSYLEGMGVARSKDQAIAWFTRAAEQGSESSAHALSVLAQEGRSRRT